MKTLSRSTEIPQEPASPLETGLPRAHIDSMMVDSEKRPVMEPFPGKEGTGWHVIIRYREGHERRIEGFASKADAVDWIEANLTQVDK
jgi:hypothetical protein